MKRPRTINLTITQPAAVSLLALLASTRRAVQCRLNDPAHALPPAVQRELRGHLAHTAEFTDVLSSLIGDTEASHTL